LEEGFASAVGAGAENKSVEDKTAAARSFILLLRESY
jgi:hypothetical protein